MSISGRKKDVLCKAMLRPWYSQPQIWFVIILKWNTLLPTSSITEKNIVVDGWKIKTNQQRKDLKIVFSQADSLNAPGMFRLSARVSTGVSSWEKVSIKDQTALPVKSRWLVEQTNKQTSEWTWFLMWKVALYCTFGVALDHGLLVFVARTFNYGVTCSYSSSFHIVV